MNKVVEVTSQTALADCACAKHFVTWTSSCNDPLDIAQSREERRESGVIEGNKRVNKDGEVGDEVEDGRGLVKGFCSLSMYWHKKSPKLMLVVTEPQTNKK